MNTTTIVLPLKTEELCRVCEIMQEEIRRRTGILPAVSDTVPSPEQSFIALGTSSSLEAWQDKLQQLPGIGNEGFRLLVLSKEPLQAVICGNDMRGCLYGVGQLLRKLELTEGRIAASDELETIAVTPRYPMRGHQLAYRDKENTCPNWSIEEFDRYIRELALFGANSIELLPPRTDDRLYSPLFHTPPMEMMTKLSEHIHSYGLDVWIWYPHMAQDYSNPQIFAEEIGEREKVFAALPYLDGILLPAGDPGDLPPKEFFAVAGEMMKVARKYHPEAKVYVAPQSFQPDEDWYSTFYAEIRKEPEWLYGVCYAPWVGDTLQDMVRKLPEKYRNRIRHYPDISHTASCQFEQPMWDSWLAMANGRESCCPRPREMKLIHNLHAPLCQGSITYSEGIHDDVNKFLWTDQDVDPERSAESLIRDYVRLMIDPMHVDEITQLIFALEENWTGDLTENVTIHHTFCNFESLDHEISENVRSNWRFKQLHQRAILDEYVLERRKYDKELESEALAALRDAQEKGCDNAIREAWNILDRTFHEPRAEQLMFRLQRMGDELFRTPFCRMQQSSRWHNGQEWIRGAWLDTINTPLNDYQYLTVSFRRILSLHDESRKLDEISRILNRTNPGEGGRYYALGRIHDFTQIVEQSRKYEEDPGFLRSPHLFHNLYGLMMTFHGRKNWLDEYPIPLAWANCARTIYATPLRMKITGLEQGKGYILDVTYPDMLEFKGEYAPVRLMINGRLIHDSVRSKCEGSHDPVFRFVLPVDIVGSDGVMEMVWQSYGVLCPVSVAEIWLRPQEGECSK